MSWMFAVFALAGALLVLAVLVLLTRRGMRWGATPDECSAPMSGDAWLEDGSAARVRMTRAITIEARPQTVWPWLAQLGRGAGWYSIDRLDNGGRASARHIVSWVPAPRLGDAAAIGYLRHLDAGRELVWWVPGARFLGAPVRSVMAYTVTQGGEAARVVVRMSADATGPLARPALALYCVIDSIMARRQLRNLKALVERSGARAADPETAETGAPDQFQLYHVIYASGEEAGVPGREHAARFRREADARGLLGPEEDDRRRPPKEVA